MSYILVSSCIHKFCTLYDAKAYIIVQLCNLCKSRAQIILYVRACVCLFVRDDECIDIHLFTLKRQLQMSRDTLLLCIDTRFIYVHDACLFVCVFEFYTCTCFYFSKKHKIKSYEFSKRGKLN